MVDENLTRPADNDEGSTTATRRRILKEEFGDNWRTWSWFRQQWNAVSLSTIGALLMVIGGMVGWASNLKTHVIVLETEVIPDLRLKDSVRRLEISDADHSARISGLETDVDDLKQDYALARREAATPPTPMRRHHLRSRVINGTEK